MVMSPNILEVMSFWLGLFYPVTATTVYFNANIMCSFTKKLLGTSSPYRGSPLDPARGLPAPDSQSSFMSPQ